MQLPMQLPMQSRRPISIRARRRRWALALAWIPMASLAASCGGEPPPVVELTDGAHVDASVMQLLREHTRRAREAPADAERRAELAMAYEANELWDEAQRSWADALALEPDRPVWRLHRAICARQAGSDTLALELLREVALQQPELAAARLRLGEALLETGDLAGARPELEAARALAPRSPEPLVSLAEALQREGEHLRAEELCRQALELAPGARRAQYVLGLALRGQGRLDEAREALQRGLEASRGGLPDPLSERIAGLRRGYAVRVIEASNLERAGRPEDARRILEAVASERPDDVTVLNNLAAVYVQLGRNEEALRLLERARAIEPGQFATYINQAGAELALGFPEDALSSATRAIELSPSVARAFFVRARAMLALGRFQEAYHDLSRSTELDATEWLPFAMLGDVAFELGRFADAVGHYEAAISRRADHLPAHTRLALAHHNLGQHEQALRAYEAARRLSPSAPDVARLARILGVAPR